jgi:branched-chain amino acid transport system substrate-binding protein
VEYFSVDDESDPSKATENANKLVKRDKVDVLVGTVHSGVALAMAKVARENKTLFLVPNAGADELTGPLCAPTLFRTSFSAWQPAYAMGRWPAEGPQEGRHPHLEVRRRPAVRRGLQGGFEKGGGKIVKEMTLPFPNVEFQPFLTEIAALKPDAVYVFAGAGRPSSSATTTRPASRTASRCTPRASSPTAPSTRWARPARACRPPCTTPTASTTRRTRPSASATPRPTSCPTCTPCRATTRPSCSRRPGRRGGDSAKQDEIIKAMEAAKIDSPRGTFTLSKAHNPVQDIYLREVQGGQNKVVSTLIRGSPTRPAAARCKGLSVAGPPAGRIAAARCASLPGLSGAAELRPAPATIRLLRGRFGGMPCGARLSPSTLFHRPPPRWPGRSTSWISHHS